MKLTYITCQTLIQDFFSAFLFLNTNIPSKTKDKYSDQELTAKVGVLLMLGERDIILDVFKFFHL